MLELRSLAWQNQGLIAKGHLGTSWVGDVIPSAWVATYQLSLMAQVSLTHTAGLGTDSVPTAMLMSPGNSLEIVHRWREVRWKSSSRRMETVPSAFRSPFFPPEQMAPADAQAMVLHLVGLKELPKTLQPFWWEPAVKDSSLLRVRAFKSQLLRKENLYCAPLQTGPLTEREMWGMGAGREES